MFIAIITESQKNELIGKLVQPNWYFNPVLDCQERWIISTEEINNSIYPENDWVKELALSEWCGPFVEETEQIWA